MSLDVTLLCNECPACGRVDEVFEQNITHNLGKMADAAGIHEAVWRPEEIGITHAKQLIEPLKKAIAGMRAEPAKYKKHNSPNGWGLYENFVPWLERYLEACEKYPDAKIKVDR